MYKHRCAMCDVLLSNWDEPYCAKCDASFALHEDDFVAYRDKVIPSTGRVRD